MCRYLISILIGIALTWTGKVDAQLSNEKATRRTGDARSSQKIRTNEENIRTLYYELTTNRTILNRIDRNTGGTGDSQPPRPLEDD